MSSTESREQGQSGRRGSEAEGNRGAAGQPPQGSDRVDKQAEKEPKHHFAEGHAPSEQGEQESPSPEQIKRGQQGLSGTGTGKQGSHAEGDRSQQEADSDG